VKYIGYIRVSRDREGGISPDQQRKEIEHWAATPGTERDIVWLPPDTDYSGKSLDRPSMQQALELLRAAAADGLVVARLDRLTRSVADLNLLIREAQSAGWNLVGLDVGVDLLTTNGKMVAHLIGAISEWYLDRVTEEWEKVRRYKIEDVGAHWGAPPLGYKRGRTVNGRGHDVPGALAVDRQWAPVVQEVFRRRAKRSTNGSWASLARYLSAAGAPNYKARSPSASPTPIPRPRWSAAGVKAIIANRAYLGEARAGKLVKPGAHPALVDEEIWSAANLRGPTFGSFTDRKGGPLLGKGLLRCGTCGGGLVRSTGKSSKVRKYEYYRCVAPTCHVRVAISAPRIERYLISEALQRLDADVLPSDPSAARTLLRKTLGGVTVHAVKKVQQGRLTKRTYAPADRVQVHWPNA
jgi:DNA invertase Pin-like site-specific DNA recombinase